MANSNDVNLANSICMFCMTMKLSSRFDTINNLDHNYSYWRILSLVCPLKYPSILEKVQRWWALWIRSINFSAFTHVQNFAVESWWTYQIDLSKSTKQNIVVILQAQHKNLNMHGTRLAGSFPASVHACLSLLLNHTNVQQETVLTCIGWPNFLQVSVHVHPCGL